MPWRVSRTGRVYRRKFNRGTGRWVTLHDEGPIIHPEDVKEFFKTIIAIIFFPISIPIYLYRKAKQKEHNERVRHDVMAMVERRRRKEL